MGRALKESIILWKKPENEPKTPENVPRNPLNVKKMRKPGALPGFVQGLVRAEVGPQKKNNPS
jgi:hypothetical protein